jgi:hypothetical protein
MTLFSKKGIFQNSFSSLFIIRITRTTYKQEFLKGLFPFLLLTALNKIDNLRCQFVITSQMGNLYKSIEIFKLWEWGTESGNGE